MEIRRLKYFIRIAELGSLTRASVALRVAQPALSRQMHLLQEELGITLFRRVLRGLELTEAGEHLLAAIRGPMQDLELAIKDTTTFASRLEGDLSIAMPSNLPEGVTLSFVDYMAHAHPNIRLRMMEGPTGLLLDWLNRGLVDFALLEEDLHDDRHGHCTLFSEPLVLVGAPGTGLRADRPISFEAMARLPLILQAHTFGIRGTIDKAASRLNAKLNIRLETDSVKLGKELVAKGLGCAILPLSDFRAEADDGHLEHCRIADADMRASITLIWRRSSKSGRTFFSALEETFRRALAGRQGAAGPAAKLVA